ncbi:MAG: YbhB/YbcL family Raf kinase inhibitor-like protein [Micromonosporaceae bacterium]|jgi:Raf kinase inhibitor-like YbhB/YbcL family protein|nr:YbhB/YbcL family Raf kinase inhibitor-like protein [Micromonosporaceae bacterium]
MAGVQLRSSAFNDHDLMPARLSKPGGNVSPPLQWSGIPEGTEELVLLCEDGDSPQPFLHWLVTGIDPATTGVDEGQVPRGGQEWPNGFGTTGWAGPQPPMGDNPHRYFFRLYAVSQPLDMPSTPTAEQVRQAAEHQELASGTLVGTFAR